jgi:PAS domain S-box-containing protein
VTAEAGKVQAALYRIAELASAAQDMHEFYAAVHGVVSELMSARNFYIALYDEERQLINFPYWADEVDHDWPEATEWIEFTDRQAHGVTGYILRTGEPELLTYERHQQLLDQGEIEIVGVLTEDTSWLGVPLKADKRTIGILVVQSYTKDVQYTEQDKELLAYVGQHVGAALSRARAIEETRQRNAELEIINGVQQALAGELELQAIYDVVGDKIRDIFDAQVVDIAVYDERSGLLHFPYSIERGIHYPDEPIKLIGFRKHVLETRRTLLIDKNLEAVAKRFGNPVLSGEMPKSVIYVPLVAGGKATGVISLQNLDREHAFSDPERRLLETLGRSLSVALENARLVHETRQRNAELALINSVQRAIAGELDAQAIYDLVGTKLQEVFDAQVVSISIYDDTTGLLSFPYVIERGERLHEAPMPLMGFRKHVIETREPLLLAEDMETLADRYGNPYVLSGEPVKSAVFAPLLGSGKATGVVSLQNVDREHAYSEPDLQLLVTLCGSLSVALENARLVQETRQRNAELALINSVQQAIAGELDPQAIYDLVGDRIQEVFDAQVVSIAIHDGGTGMLELPYAIERGKRLSIDPIPLIGFRKHVMETGEPLLINENVAEEAERYGNPLVLAGEMPKSDLFVPLHVGGRPTGVISLQNLDREHAFTESDKRLLVTLAGSLGVALDNARLVHETKQRVAELALINSVQDSIAGELDQQAIYDLVGEKLEAVFDAQAIDIAVHDEKAGLLRFVWQIERGVHFPNVTMPVIGFRKHVMETREPLAILENMQAAIAEYGNPQAVTGETSYGSAIFQPLVVGGRSTGVISIHNLDREHAFSASDQQLLATIAGSLGVALDNAQLIHETRQRVAELGTVNSIGQAVASQLDLDALIELVGERMRETFDADIVYVALHDDDAGRIDFAYYSEEGEQRYQEPMQYGEGFTSQILDSGEPLLLNRSEHFDEVKTARVGTPARSYLGVPILVGEKAIGVISVQSMYEDGRFGDADAHLLATIAASVGVAIQNARLFEAQREAERRYRQLVEELPLAVYRAEPVAKAAAEYISPRVEEIFGYPRERWSDPEFFASILHPDDRDETIAKQAAALAHGDDHWSIEYRLIAADGRTLFVRDDAWIAKDGQGKPVYVQGFMMDVTDEAFAHAEIRRQKQYFESLVGISPVAVIVMDADERVTAWNPAAAELFGYSAEEAIGRPIDDLVFQDGHRDEGREITREALEAGRAQRIARRERKDGTPVDVELMLVPLNVDGEHVGFYAIYHDISELQRAREEAEAATQAKSAFLATMSHEIRTPMNAVIGMTGLLLGTELKPEQREYAEVVRSSGDALLHVIDDILDYSKIEAGKLELEHEPFDLRECVEGALDIVAPRAWEKEIELGCLIDEEAPAGIVGDAARLGQVLLNLLSNAVKFTERGEVVVHVGAERAGRSKHRLHLAVRDTGIGIPPDRMDRLFASFSQVDASTTRRYGGTGLGLAISKRLVELMGGSLQVESEVGKGSTFHISLTARGAKVPARISAQDALPRLSGKRILVVDDNATNREIVSRQARSWGMEPVAVELPSQALALIEAGEHFDVAVLDMLMPEMDGLALARELRQRRDERELPLLLLTSLGRVPQARSSGEFAVQLAKPLKASQLYDALISVLAGRTDAAPSAQPEVDAAKPTRSTLRILLAEDNAVNQQVALHLLEKLGHRADVATNGLEAIAALERQAYDVVLMDVQMPELDGLDATRQICARWPPDTRPRIIAMTANAMAEDREACFAAGMDDYVAKPIRPDALAQALSRARPRRAPSENGGIKLDAAALESLRELGGEEFLAELIGTFLSDAPALLATLRTARETEELRRAAHTLKSNGQTFGAGGFAELCRELEERARSGELSGADELIDRIEGEYAALEKALTALRLAPAT